LLGVSGGVHVSLRDRDGYDKFEYDLLIERWRFVESWSLEKSAAGILFWEWSLFWDTTPIIP
jgi:hypothetical protein